MGWILCWALFFRYLIVHGEEPEMLIASAIFAIVGAISSKN